jgi:site-specific DNA-methyltransferase (adenine-specific)
MKLYNDDCLKVMDELIEEGVEVDSIITDPPYGMSYQSGHRKEKHNRIENDDGLDWLDEFVEKCYLISKDNTAHYFFCSWHNIEIFKQSIQKKFNVKDILVWEKNNTSMGDLYHTFAPKVEFIIFAQKGQRKINGKRTPNIMKFSRTNNDLHPTQKPVDLMEHLIEKFTNENEIVFDPFMGSGSTGVAALQLNRDFIGVELDKTHFETAKKRLEKVERKVESSLDEW